MYIVRRTQLYLDEPLWDALHLEARQTGATVSELVRTAARERYLGGRDARKRAMLAFIGSGKERWGAIDSTKHILAPSPRQEAESNRGMTVLLDSDILIEVSRGRNRAIDPIEFLRFRDMLLARERCRVVGRSVTAGGPVSRRSL